MPDEIVSEDMHLHGSTKIKVDLRKSDALSRFKGSLRFHEYKGLKRVLSIIIIIIIRKRRGVNENRKKLENEEEEEEEEEEGGGLILILRTAHPLAGFSSVG